MSHKTFEQAMGRIADEAHTEEQEELRAKRRRETFGIIRRACIALLGAVALVLGFIHRQEVHDFISSKFGGTPQISHETSDALKGIQEHAAKRDKTLDEITK